VSPRKRGRRDAVARAATVEVVGGDATRASTERNPLLATRGDLLVAVWTNVFKGGGI
jgi:hypothetical protein